ncbi:hypothetical protein ACET3Z_019920 [Daucus carota]
MIFVPVFDDSDGGSESQPMEPRNIYKAEVDMSGVPKIFGRFEGGGSLYQYPEDDTELLGLCWTPSAKMRWIGGKFVRTKIYHVEMEAESCTVEDFLKVLKGIGCEDLFIACSVERANLFFVELNEDSATRLRGSSGICDVYPRG